MKKPTGWLTLALAAAMAIAGLLLTWAPARADVYDCIGSSHPATVDDLRVPQNQTCTLNGTRVEGNITVESGGTLHAYAVRVDGNVQSDGGAAVHIYQNSRVGGSVQADNVGQITVHPGTYVGGSVQIKSSGSASVTGVDVDSDILFDANSQALTADNNIVGGNVQVFQNLGGVAITNNTIDGNLQCKSNVPAPTGWANVVQGSMEDQCANFGVPGPTPTPTPTPGITPTPTPIPTPPPDDDLYICIDPATHPVSVDNLRVPQGATCTLNGTHVDGNIEVRSNATLHAYLVRVQGNIQSDGGAAIHVYHTSRVGGSIQADNVGQVSVHPGTLVIGNVQIKTSGSAAITGVEIDGDLQFDANREGLVADRNTIEGNLQAFQNTGKLLVTANTIDGNLQCKANAPAPVGWSNVVNGNLEDQCATFDAPPPTTYLCADPPPHPGSVLNVQVPQNATCTLNGTRVDGDIDVRGGATLHASAVHVHGSVLADGSATVNVNHKSHVNGSVRVERSTSAAISGTVIDQDLVFNANTQTLYAGSNTVGGNLQATSNAGRLLLTANAIDGALTCSDNTALTGWRNIAAALEGQCATLDQPPASQVHLPSVAR